MKIVAAIAAAALLSACATTGNLSPDQMANARGAFCFIGPGWNGGSVTTLYSNLDGTVKCGGAEMSFAQQPPAAK